MDGWMDGSGMEGRRDEWMDGSEMDIIWVDGLVGGWVGGWMGGWIGTSGYLVKTELGPSGCSHLTMEELDEGRRREQRG